MYDKLVATLRRQCVEMDCGNCETCVKRQAADAIEEMSREIDVDNAAMTAMDAAMLHWIPVTERLPEKYQYAVCWVNDEENKMGFYGIGSLSRIGDWYVDGDDYSENGNLHVTHWMPLPEPPKEET